MNYHRGMFEEGLAELHTHLGGSVASDIMWSLGHEQGLALPTRDFWEFDRMVTVSDPRGVPDLDSLDRIYHLTELIQSSPIAVERSVHAAIGAIQSMPFFPSAWWIWSGTAWVSSTDPRISGGGGFGRYADRRQRHGIAYCRKLVG